MELAGSSVNKDWDNWKRFLSEAMEFAGELGVSREKISLLAGQAGEILADSVQPANAEQRVLKELWSVSDQQEKKVIANLMTKLCSKI
ncbi:MAG: DUF3243 domain-containing protein [Actinobacteria bacterium]|nr:DUF3243 domain-containing protein [Actinomycetota bacterium]